MPNEAILYSEKDYTVFKYGKHTIRFLAPYSLERYTEVKEWNHGYLVVMAKYSHNAEPEEEYIDLIPILQNLYFDVEEFLKPIEKVKIQYDDIVMDNEGTNRIGIAGGQKLYDDNYDFDEMNPEIAKMFDGVDFD